MADFNINARELSLTSLNAAFRFNSGLATISMPSADPLNTPTPSLPYFLGFNNALGTSSWFSSTRTENSSFNRIAMAAFSVQATYTRTVSQMAPGMAGPISCQVMMIGAGGGGALAATDDGNLSGSGGGASGAMSINTFTGLTPSSSFTFTVGAGGGGAVAQPGPDDRRYGAPGGATLLTYGAAIYGANGGGGGGVLPGLFYDPALCKGGAGGVAGIPTGGNTASTLSFAGSDGGSGFRSQDLGAVFAGGNGAPSFLGGLTSGPVYADTTPVPTHINGISGRAPGCGGSGYLWLSSGPGPNQGGNGADGLVLFRFIGVTNS